MDWTFGTLLWGTLVFFFWFAVIWMFVGVFADIFRRDLSGWAKAGWVFLIVVLPFLGILIYLIARPHDLEVRGSSAYQAGEDRRSAADEIAKATDLYEQGKITTVEYQQIKERALA